MAKRSKNYLENKAKIVAKDYSLTEAVNLLKDLKRAKFEESVDVAIRLNVDPKYPDQMVRGTVVLPHGLGKSMRVLVIATGEKQKEAQDAGADFVGGEEIVEKIQKENWFDYDVIVSTPDMMKSVGKLGKLLGPKGLMPSPKAGTVTFNLKECINDVKKGRVEFKVDKTGIIHSCIGKISFANEKIIDNARDFVVAVIKSRPPAVKGRFVKSIYLSSTMSPSIKLNSQEFEG